MHDITVGEPFTYKQIQIFPAINPEDENNYFVQFPDDVASFAGIDNREVINLCDQLGFRLRLATNGGEFLNVVHVKSISRIEGVNKQKVKDLIDICLDNQKGTSV